MKSRFNWMFIYICEEKVMLCWLFTDNIHGRNQHKFYLDVNSYAKLVCNKCKQELMWGWPSLMLIAEQLCKNITGLLQESSRQMVGYCSLPWQQNPLGLRQNLGFSKLVWEDRFAFKSSKWNQERKS